MTPPLDLRTWSSKHLICICPEYLFVLPFQVAKIVYLLRIVNSFFLKQVLVSDVRLQKTTVDNNKSMSVQS